MDREEIRKDAERCKCSQCKESLFLLSEIDRLEAKVKELTEGIKDIPWTEYYEALSDGCDANGAWDCFSEACDEHFRKVLEKE